MNRRHFLAATAATAALASTTSAPAGPSGRLKVIVPPMRPAEIDDLKAAAPEIDLVVVPERGRGDRAGPRGRRLLRLHHPGGDPGRQVAPLGPAARAPGSRA